MKNCILFERLSFFTLPVIIWFKLRNKKIYAYQVQESFRPWLSKLGIELVNSSQIYGQFQKTCALADQLAVSIFNQRLENSALMAHFIQLNKIPTEEKQRLKIVMIKMLQAELAIFAEVFVYAQEYAADLWSSGHPLLKGIDSPILHSNKVISFSFIRPLTFIWDLFKRLPKKATLSQTKTIVDHRPKFPKQQHADLKNYQVIFFPHKGIWYSNLFKKDHYYSENPDSPFHYTKILTLSMGESEDWLNTSYPYYQENKIPYLDFYQLSHVSIKQAFMQFCLPLLLKFPNWSETLFWSQLHYSLQKNLSALDKIPSAKLALFGYDLLIPPPLSLALALRQVKTLATQERFVPTFVPTLNVICDFYFTIAKPCAQFIRDPQNNFYVEEIEELGPIRLDSLFEESQHLSSEKYLNIKKEHFLLLALPFHPALSEEENRLQIGNHWRTISIFYDLLIQAAQRFPRLYVCIKGKNLDIQQVPFFDSIVKRIEQLPNIEIEEDLDTYTPYKLSALADGCVAHHTSLGDEILAAGKPVLFYDMHGYPNPFYQYENLPLITDHPDSFFARLEKMLKGEFFSSKEVNILEQKIYGQHFDGQIKYRLHQKMQQKFKKLQSPLNIGIITQARMGSTRLPGKVLKKIGGKTLLSYHLERLKWSNLPIFLTTGTDERNQPIEDEAKGHQIAVFKGPEEDVLTRFYQCAKQNQLDIIIRVTSDCPLIDGQLIRQYVDAYLQDYHPLKYWVSDVEESFPRGLDFEIFSFQALEEAYQVAKEARLREHVTLYFYSDEKQKNHFQIKQLGTSENNSDIRLTVDVEQDFQLIEDLLLKYQSQNKNYQEIIQLFRQHPQLQQINRQITQKEV